MKCPGQDSRYWKEDAIFHVQCPKCRHEVEFFKDDTSRRCMQCGHRFVNPNLDFGCASYCEFADQCLGTLPPELLAEKEDLLKDRVAIEMKRYFKTDFKRIGHAMRVARHSERIGKGEKGNLAVILCAALLHDIDIPDSEEKYVSSVSEYQGKEGPSIAESILIKLGAKKELIDEVCHIIRHHHYPGTEESTNSKVLHDANLISNLEEKHREIPIDPEKIKRIIEEKLLTDWGRTEARKTFETR